MNEKFKAVFGIGIAGFIVLFAGSGKPFLEALMGFPALVKAWSAGLPLGLWSVLMAMVASMSAWAFSIRWLPDEKDGQRPQFAAATIAILVAIAVTVGQQWQGGAGAVLNALWMGLSAGVAAPYFGNGLRSLFTAKHKSTPDA